MSEDDEFRPRLGRQRQQGGKKARRYLGRVVGAAIRSAEKGSVRSRRFDGSRIGRGASMGRLLSSRDRLGGMRARRAVVKTRLVRIGSKGMPAARAHLRYIQRDGVTREGAPGELYSADHDTADGKAFLQRCDGARRLVNRGARVRASIARAHVPTGSSASEATTFRHINSSIALPPPRPPNRPSPGGELHFHDHTWG